LAASAWPGIRILVANRARAFLEDVEATIHLNGQVDGLEKISRDDVSLQSMLPSPPRTWGPQRPNYLGSFPYVKMPPDYSSMIAKTVNPVSFKNSGSVTITVRVDDLRLRDTFESEDDDIVLVLRAPSLSVVKGTWQVTARGHHEVFEGELVVPVTETQDLTDPVRRMLAPEMSQSLD
jgi:hypothetical protein